MLCNLYLYLYIVLSKCFKMLTVDVDQKVRELEQANYIDSVLVYCDFTCILFALYNLFQGQDGEPICRSIFILVWMDEM